MIMDIICTLLTCFSLYYFLYYFKIKVLPHFQSVQSFVVVKLLNNLITVKYGTIRMILYFDFSLLYISLEFFDFL